MDFFEAIQVIVFGVAMFLVGYVMGKGKEW